MSRPKAVELFMHDVVLGDAEREEVRKHILSLESQLPPEPEEETWTKERSQLDGYAILNICGKRSSIVYDEMPERIIDEILRNRELVRRGIDSRKLWHEYGCDPTNRILTHAEMNAIDSLIEAQIKGDV